MITHQLVVSYTTFSPLPTPGAVILFCRHLLSPIASIFRSGAPYTARTFLSHPEAPATDRSSAFGFFYNGLQVVVILHIKRRSRHITRLVTLLQPTLTLITGTMGKRLGCGPALSLLLQPVVANGLSQLQTFL